MYWGHVASPYSLLTLIGSPPTRNKLSTASCSSDRSPPSPLQRTALKWWIGLAARCQLLAVPLSKAAVSSRNPTSPIPVLHFYGKRYALISRVRRHQGRASVRLLKHEVLHRAGCEAAAEVASSCPFRG